MLKLRVNPIAVNDLKGIHKYIAEDNSEMLLRLFWTDYVIIYKVK